MLLPMSRSSSLSWLDRLRSSKGLPVAPDDDDLDRFLFLSGENPNPVNGLAPLAPAVRKTMVRGGGEGRMFGLISSVLADLFVMDSPLRDCDLGLSKASRKQARPRICPRIVSASDEIGCRAAEAEAPPSPPSGENSVAEAAVFGVRPVRGKQKRKRGNDMRVVSAVDGEGYSRMEVTVIDTSICPNWKSNKIILRKGSAWKVKEKKFSNLDRKRRRLVQMDRLSGEKEKRMMELKAPVQDDSVEPLYDGRATRDPNDDARPDPLVHSRKRRRRKFASANGPHVSGLKASSSKENFQGRK